MSAAPYTSAVRSRILGDLNPAQVEAVTHEGGPLLVVAGAGTGKTRVLTRRVAWLAAGGIPPSSLLAITFTNKAAQVLKTRLASLLPQGGAWAGTFHAWAAGLLRRHGLRIGIDPGFSILDRDDQRQVVRGLLQDLAPTAAALRPADVVAMLSHVKNGGGGRPPMDLSDPLVAGPFEEAARRYAARLRSGRGLDFDDLLLEALRLLREDEGAREACRRRYAHVLVDEYQDTNVVQADLLKALVGPPHHVTVVGDPDQSIYRWRGASVENILRFERDFPGARRILLEQNYRSPALVLEAAERVIARNRQRHEKRLFTGRDEGPPIDWTLCPSGEDEAEAVADLVEEWVRSGRRLDEVAVFYRVNSHSRALEMALKARGVPYVVVAGQEFFQRREVRDLLAYARLVENPRDEAAFLRIANVPRRGVGNVSLERLRRRAAAQGLSTPELARSSQDGLSARARKGMEDLLALLGECEGMPRAPVAPILERLAGRSGYFAMLQEETTDLGPSRLENAEELVVYARGFDRREEGGDLRSFLEEVALISDQDALEEEGGRASLMSVHAAKGLEFPFVIVSGAENGYFPHTRSVEDVDALEEERRLFYVAMTRAQERLAFTTALNRFTWAQEGPREPSPFLQDVPPAAFRLVDRAGGGPWTDAPGTATIREGDDTPPVGARVRHPHFGAGTLRDRRGSGAEARVTVDFDAYGRKQLLLRHARLERLS